MSKLMVHINVFCILESIKTELIGDPEIFQIYYIKTKNPANYAFGVAFSISKSLSGGSGSLIYNVMNITTTRINPSGCVNGTRRRRRSTVDLSKYVVLFCFGFFIWGGGGGVSICFML